MCRATTSAGSTGGCTRAPTASTSRSTRRTRTRTSRCCSTCRSRWATAAAAMTKLDYARMLAGCLTYLVHRQRDRVGFVAFDDDIVEHVPPSAKHMESMLHVLDRLKPTQAGQPARAAAQDGGALRPARPAGPDLGFLRGAGRGARRDRAAAFPRQRPHRVPPARRGGAELRLLGRRRRSRIWRAASRCRSCRTCSPSSTVSWSRPTPRR